MVIFAGEYSELSDVVVQNFIKILSPHMNRSTTTDKPFFLCSNSRYNGSISAPPRHYGMLCPQKCHNRPVYVKNIFNGSDYPIDEWHLAEAFQDRNEHENGAKWLNHHFENFVSYQDLKEVKEAGITHLRVPMPHWILGDIDYEAGEPWIVGERWKYFHRLVGWCRRLGLQVWPNIHTAPGSQNGFDNSGLAGPEKTAKGWCGHPSHIQRSLRIIDSVTKRIISDGMNDVVTGFGLLNEPFADCNMTIYRKFLDDGFQIVRQNLGEEISIFASDLFLAQQFNDGEWWLNPEIYSNTYLDSHYYNLFDQPQRFLSPKAHVDEVCNSPVGKGDNILDCCFEDAPATNSTPSQGIGRIVAEWSVAYDAMPGDLLKVIRQGLRQNGVAALQDRQLNDQEKDFLHNFAKAQIVSYEEASVRGLSHGWFFWSLKMEGGAFIEWDFLRGLREGWFPKIQSPDSYSEKLYGSCDSISNQTTDDMSIIHPFPECGNDTYWDPNGYAWQFDYEQQYGVDETEEGHDDVTVLINRPNDRSFVKSLSVLAIFAACFYCWRHWLSNGLPSRNRKEYTEIAESDTENSDEELSLSREIASFQS